MARSEHLPIYKASYNLCLYLEQVVRNFARYHKYSLGQENAVNASLGLGGIDIVSPPEVR